MFAFRTVLNRVLTKRIIFETVLEVRYLSATLIHNSNNKGPRIIRLIPQKDPQNKPEKVKVDPKEINFQQKHHHDVNIQRFKTARPIKSKIGDVSDIKLEPTVQKFIPKLQTQLLPKLEAPHPKLEEIVVDENVIKEVVQNKARTGNIISTVTQTDSSKKDNKEDNSQSERENSWQTMKFTFTLFGISFTGIGLYLLLELGKPKVNEDGEIVQDEFSNMPAAKQYVFRTVQQLDYYRRLINEPSREKLLPDELKYPYHQPPYTLVLELKDVLVHPDWTYNTGWRFKKRPGIDQFLETLNGIYEIVIYTAELGMTVFPILEALDPNNLITYKLVRDATNFVDGKHVKDLDKLNRPLRKVVVVDWDEDAIASNRDNALVIPRWNGDDNDTALLDLANLLRVIAISEIQDVREVLRFYKEYENPLAAFRDRQRELERTMYSNK